MSTSVTWPGGGTGAVAAAYSIPAAGELNWSALSNFLVALGQGAQGTTFQKFAIRKATTSPVTVAVTDCVVGSKLAVAGAVTMNLPAGADKQIMFLFDDTGDAATNNITINRSGSDTIRTATTYVISQNYGWVLLAFNAADTDWKVIAEGSRISTLTASRALASNAAGNVAVSTVTTTQLQYLASASGTSGTGSIAFTNSPSFTTPALGTPSAGVLSSCTAYPFSALTGTASSSQVTTATFVAPTVQKFTSGTAQTYTAPSSPRAPLYIIVELVGGGGGGGGSGTASASSDGGNGTATTWSVGTLSAGGGASGPWGGNSGSGGSGGTASLGSGVGFAMNGNPGGNGGKIITTSTVEIGGGDGGVGFFGGGGKHGTQGGGGGSAIANSGSGGGGAGHQNIANSFNGCGGGAGAYVRAVIANPTTATYTVGAGGAAGGAGTNGYAGGTGAAGVIIVTEMYQ